MPTAARSRVGTSEIAASGRLASRKPLGQRGMDRARRAMAVGAAAQDHGVAGFQGQRAGVGGDVRPALVDHADDAERHFHALDGHAVRPRPGFGDPADRIGEPAHHVEAFGHRLDALVVQRQPVERGGGQARGLAVGEVVGVGGEDVGSGWRGSRPPCRRARGFSASVEASASTRAAALALRPMSLMVAAISPDPSTVFSGAVMVA